VAGSCKCCGGSGGGSEALKIALKTEQEGREMYLKAAHAAAHPFGKKMLESLAEDEASHVRMIEKIAKGMGMDVAVESARKGTPRDRIVTIFTGVKDKVAKKLAASTDEVEALKTAMEFEKKGWEFYEASAKKASDKNEKELFTRLAAEESQHYDIVRNTYEYLEDTKHWYTWAEKSLLDG